MPTSNSNQHARLNDIYQNIPLSNRNYIVDGNFDNWINSSVSVSGNTFVTPAVMWYSGSGTGGVATITRNAFNGADVVAMTSPATYYYSHAQTTASTSNGPSIVQHIEGCRTLHGRSATFSCWLWVPNGNSSITISGVSYSQFYGVGGSGTNSLVKTVNWVVTATPQKFSVRIDFPTVGSGITVGTSDYINFTLGLPGSSIFTLNTTQWQLEETSPNAPATGLPTAFEYRGIQAEVARVQRYYGTGTVNFSSGSGSVGTQVGSEHQFKTTMRTIPIMTVTNASVNGVATAPNTTAYPDSFYLFHAASAANTTAGYTDTWVADARL